jgi:conjugal transfer pilus assembly protein TraF
MHRIGRVMLLPVLAAQSLAAADDGGFFLRKDEGWFWYHDPPLAEDPSPEEPAPLPTATGLLVPGSLPDGGPVPLSAQWLSEHLPQYLNTALDDPSPANVTAYLYLQRYALDKSSRFADAAELAAISDPYLDENTRRPIATFGAQLRTRASAEAMEATLAGLADSVGLYFFFRSDCPYCHEQAPILKALEALYGFRVLAVSLDQRPLPGDPYPDYIPDRGQSQLLQVVATPALYLVKPESSEIVPVAQGLLSLSEFKDRIVKLAHEAGWIGDREFERTRPADTVLLAANDRADAPTDEVLMAPERLVEYIRGQISR